MNWWQLILLWLGGWIAIIGLNLINISTTNHPDDDIKELKINYTKNELVSDANSLFSTGLVYFIFNVICNFFNYAVLHWILFIVAVAFCIVPIISIIGVIRNAKMNGWWLIVPSALISDIVTLLMAINIYVVHLK